MAHAQFPQIPDLELPVSKTIGDGTDLNFGKYTVTNPHPGYGKDPNIINCFGHTMYPKFVGNVIVNSKEEEDALNSPTPEAAPKGWE